MANVPSDRKQLKDYIKHVQYEYIGSMEDVIEAEAGAQSLLEVGASLMADGAMWGANAARKTVRVAEMYPGVNRPSIAEIIYQLAGNDKAREALVLLTEIGYAATSGKLTLTKEDKKQARKAINTFDAAFTKEWIKTAEESCIGDGWQPPVPYK